MYLGQIVELADSLELCAKPLHPYTQALFTAAVPSHPDERHEKLTITGEVPSALDPPSGCRFHPRCPHAMPQCAREAPVRKEIASQHHRRLPLILSGGSSRSKPVSVTQLPQAVFDGLGDRGERVLIQHARDPLSVGLT